MVNLNEKQFSLSSLVFGTRDTGIVVTDFEPGGKPDTTSQDTAITGADGIWFGRDYLTGRTINFEGACAASDAAGAWALYQSLSSAWDAASVRNAPGALLELSMCMPGASQVSVFGRPRNIDPVTTQNVTQGFIPWTATFQAVDYLYYSANENNETLTLIPPDNGGGFEFPVTFPSSLAQASTLDGRITVAGDATTWPVIRFNAPSTGSLVNPAVTYSATGITVKLQATLTPGQFIEVDTRPWARTVTNQTGGSVAGLMRGDPMSSLSLEPGDTELSFTGEDPSGTSTVSFVWRDASVTPYFGS
jgi:hypothetical protein